ncbi:helix-turn-helix domain-containing protein [Nocardia nova SH22a]|uniref:Helix-turn-helix domain-containing protein n=2 Tax=Nocardia nova TaxID=37330 RepID=W5TU70_9NOCA|nr:helix-turn-helix domain-containing protein [Nocardia nova SH22a]
MRQMDPANLIKQAQLADAAGIARNSLSQMERGEMVIDIDQLGRIAGFFDLGPDELLTHALQQATASELRELISSAGVVVGQTTEQELERIESKVTPKPRPARKSNRSNPA